jgi:NitT/TauT family transport system permease protein
VKLPSALGSIFAGLQIAVVLGLIGAVVGEFMSSREGLGFVIQSSSFELNIAMMFASIVTLTAIGMIGIALVRIIHARVVFWEGETAGRANVAAP